MTAAIHTDALTKTFGNLRALDSVSLQIAAGECTALVGPNGAGKSTLFKLCLGLMRSDAGHISVLGCEPADASFGNVKRRIGFLPEQVMFQPSLTGQETMRFYARLKGANVRDNEAILQRVRLSDAAGRRIGTYSKGMRQRLGLAQSLIGNPNLLLLETIETPFHDQLIKGSIRVENGFVTPPTTPGLGIEVDEELARAHPYSGDGLHLQMQEEPCDYVNGNAFQGGAPATEG